MMVHNGILGLRRNPHAAARSLPLKVAFVQSPQVHPIVRHQLPEFFYASSAAAVLLGPRPDEACGAGTRIVGTTAGIGALPVALHRSCRSTPTASSHPTDSPAFPHRSAWPAKTD